MAPRGKAPSVAAMEFGSPGGAMSPATPEGGTRMSRTKHTDRNLAARMGRWSADHWKTATFGWLAFVLVAFGLGGAVGTKNIANSAGPGESGRMDRILEAGFEQPASERVLIQSRSQRVGTIPPSMRRSRMSSRASRKSRTSATSARRSSPETRAQIEGRALRTGRVPDPRRQGEGGRQDRSRPGHGCRCSNVPIQASRSASSAMRAPRRGSWPPMTRTSARPARSRFRSR